MHVFGHDLMMRMLKTYMLRILPLNKILGLYSAKDFSEYRD